MATYVNDLRLKEIATGDESGTWGTSTNTNLELIAEAFSYGTEVITTNADTHTTTIADGATDPGRSLYLKYTGTLDSACTITIGPNTVSKVWIIENGTSGSQDIILSQGSGANITIPAGDTKVVYSDGAGAGAAFFDAFASLNVVDLKVQDDLTVTGDIDVDGTTNLDIVDIDGAVDMASTALVTGVLTTTAATVFNGGFASNAASTISLADNGTQLTLISTDADAAVGPVLDLFRNSASPANFDIIGKIVFSGEDNGGNKTDYVHQVAYPQTVTGGSEQGFWELHTLVGGTDRVRIDASATEVSINNIGIDSDFRVESDNDANALFVQGSDGYVGIGTSSPSDKLTLDSGQMRLSDNYGIRWGSAATAIYGSAGAGTLQMYTNSAEAMRIDSSGNVGIGETNPEAKLHVKNASAGTFTASGSNLLVENNTTVRISMVSPNTNGCAIEFGDTDDQDVGEINYDHANNYMAFTTAAAEAMRIDSSGNVGIGDTSPVAPLTIKGRGTFSINNTDFTMGNNLYYDSVSDRWERLTASAGAAVYLTGGMLQFYNTTAGGATGDLVTATQRFQINSSGRQAYNGSATANGHGNFVGEVGTGYKALMFEHTVGGGEVGKIVTTASTVALSSTSDYRLKENVDYTWDATTRLKQLKPCRFNWIIDETNTLSDGFLAHEVSSIIPEAVSGEKDAMQDKEYEVTPAVLDDDGNVVTEAVMGTRSLPDYQGIDQSKLVPLLTKALQEQQTLIESLTTRLETLENA
jgi:hypothetical protein